MLLEDLAFKLLPFTSFVNDKAQLTKWANLEDGDKIITFIEVMLFIIFILAFLRLMSSWWKDKRSILSIHKLLAKYEGKDISQEYNNFQDDLAKVNPKVQSLWNEFDESLIKKHNVDGTYSIRNSIDSEYFFNKSNMINHVGSKLISAVPSVLLGIGLLGTFFGLYVALVQLNVSNEEQLTESIKILINMAGVKFAASIWGLGLSVVFTIIEKTLEFNLDGKLEHIQVTINEMFERETAEQNLDKILVENEQQTLALNGLATSLTEKIATEFNTMFAPKIDSMNEHFANLPHHISSSVSKTLEKPLEDLSSTVKNITSNQAEQSTEALETIINKFIEKIDNVAGNQGEMLKESALQSQQILQDTSSNLSQTFESINKMMASQKDASDERDQKILQDLEQIKYSQSEMLESFSTKVTGNIEHLNDSITENLGNLIDSIGKANIEQADSFTKRESVLVDKVNRLLEESENNSNKQLERENTKNLQLETMLDSLKNTNKEVIGNLGETVQSQVQTLNNSTSEMVSKLTEQFEKHIQSTNSNMEDVLNRVKGEVVNIDQIFAQMAQKFSVIPEQIDKFNISMDKLNNFEQTQKEVTVQLRTFSDNLRQVSDNISLILDNLSNSSSILESTNKDFNGTISHTKELLSHMKDDFSNLVEKNANSIDRLGKNLDKSLEQYHINVEEALKSRVIPRLDSALSEYTQKMGYMASLLK